MISIRYSSLRIRLAILLALVVHVPVSADDAGLQRGDPVGAFYVTKLAGAPQDGVAVGESLCYRCRFGSRPMMLLFLRDVKIDGESSASAQWCKLLSQLDQEIAQENESGFRCLVTLLGKDSGILQDVARQLAKDAELTRLPIAVAKDTVSGPANVRIPADATAVIITAVDSQVVEYTVSRRKNFDVKAAIDQLTRLLRPELRLAKRAVSKQH
ncbi:MAG: hypothetical protein AAF958_13545 [Planctomycetota bacterium]